jgi:hypothetical protein
VVGALPGGVCLKDDRQYEACISLTGLIGEMGLEVVGAASSMKIELWVCHQIWLASHGEKKRSGKNRRIPHIRKQRPMPAHH